ncbi:PAS domain-containing sensor histidine kinase [Inediibacterium massiliense]|uniref:PAS domain-containing sensor histidine kinase n=1 Tax=Inediibacterium massiliense TaxID=1658111 RepID=UPI0006B51AD7|nr:PAS domain-containing sensor histidine kinase [Inediibacterium massiliense]
MKSLKIKIPMFIILLVVFTILASSYASYKIFSEQIRKHIVNENERIGNMVSDQVNQYLLDAQNTVEYVAKNATGQSMENIQKHILEVYNSYRWMDVMFFMSVDGKIVYSIPHNDIIYHRDYVKREYYHYIIENKKTYISKVFISSLLNQPHIMIVSPIFKPHSTVMSGMIGGGVPLESIRDIIYKTQKSYDGRIYVIDNDRKILVSPEHEHIGKKVFLQRKIQMNHQTYTLDEIIKKNIKGVGKYEKGLHTVYISFHDIENYEGLVVVERDEAYIGEEIKRIQKELIPWIIMIMITALILSLFIAYTITKPIEKLVIYTRKISKDIKQGLKGFRVTKNNEIGELQLAFYRMSKDLDTKIEDLKTLHKKEQDTRKYLNNILRSAGMGVIVINEEKQIVIFNKTSEDIIGVAGIDVIGEKVERLVSSLYFPDEIFSISQKEKNKIIEKEYKIQNSKKEEVFISMIISSVYNDDGEIIGIVCLMKDVTRIKMLEEQLKREDKLKTIGELSSAIIHEIGNPLAGMTNLLEVLKENMDHEDVREEIIHALIEEVGMLNNIVINYLEFTRMHNNEKVYVNILHIIDSALNILKSEIRYKQIRIMKQFPSQVPLIKVSPSAIRQAIVNIIKNGIQAVDNYGIIQIKVQGVESNNVMISIKDNGNGMDEDVVDKIFNPFFSTKEDGTGLGLSIVHKIIKDNNGNISVKSQKEEGTDFILTFEGGDPTEGTDY